MADGTSFTVDIPVKGAPELDKASQALKVLSTRMDAANKAVESQAAAYAEAEKVTDSLAKKHERLGVAIAAANDKVALGRRLGKDTSAAEAQISLLTEKQVAAEAAAGRAREALRNEARALDVVKDAADKAAKAFDREKDALEKHEPAYEKIARGLHRIGGPAADAGAKISELGGGFTKLQKAFGPVAGLAVGAGVALVALAAAAVGALFAIGDLAKKTIEWSLSMVDADNRQRRLAQGMVQSVKAGSELYDNAKALARQYPVTAEEATRMGAWFAFAGLRGKDLANAMRQNVEWAARLKFGPNFREEMLSLDQQSKVFHANLLGVFGGLKFDGLLSALQKMVALFDESTASGRAIKVIFESILQPLVDAVANSKYKVEAFFLDIEILALQAFIALKPHASLILKVGEAFAVGAAIIAGVFTVAVVASFAPLAVLVGALGTLALAFVKVWEVGGNIVEGIVDGIKKSGGKVLDALKSVVSDAVNGVKKFLGISSPSKVFAEIGVQSGEGMEQGIQSSSGGVRDAMESMSSPEPAAKAAAASGGVAAGGKASINLAGATFTFNGVKDAQDAEQKFGALLTRLLEGDAAQIGGAVPA